MVKEMKFLLKKVVFFIFLLFPHFLFSIETVSVNAYMDNSTLFQNIPLQGTIEITHDVSQKVEDGSVTLEGSPLKITLMRNVTIAAGNPLVVSIYRFSLPAKKSGSYTLGPINLTIGGKSYQTTPLSFQVQAGVNPVVNNATATVPNTQNSLQLEAFIKGAKELYPGQTTTLVYRYLYEGSIDLTKEVLPMFDADGLQMMGRKEMDNYTEGNKSVFQISQAVQALKPGDYSWGPSVVEGVVYIQDSLGNKQYTNQLLKSEAKAVTLQVKPFPEKGKPASFNGAFGDFTVTASLTTPNTVSVGDPLTIAFTVRGSNTNWNTVFLPDLCCQPGFAGFFQQSGLPPVGTIKDSSKQFLVTMQALVPIANQIPALQFSFFEPSKAEYKTVYTEPIAITVAGIKEIADEKLKPLDFTTDESIAEWIKRYRTVPEIDSSLWFPLSPLALLNYPFSGWWVLWLIPLAGLGIILQIKLKENWQQEVSKNKRYTSQDIQKKLVSTKKGTSLYFQLLQEFFLQKLKEKQLIAANIDAIDSFQDEGLEKEIKDLWMQMEMSRYKDKKTSQNTYELYQSMIEALLKKLDSHA